MENRNKLTGETVCRGDWAFEGLAPQVKGFTSVMGSNVFSRINVGVPTPRTSEHDLVWK